MPLDFITNIKGQIGTILLKWNCPRWIQAFERMLKLRSKSYRLDFGNYRVPTNTILNLSCITIAILGKYFWYTHRYKLSSLEERCLNPSCSTRNLELKLASIKYYQPWISNHFDVFIPARIRITPVDKTSSLTMAPLTMLLNAKFSKVAVMESYPKFIIRSRWLKYTATEYIPRPVI